MYKVLCLEDEPISAFIMERFLQKEFEVQMVNDCSGCYEAIIKQRFDVVLLDIHLGTENKECINVMQTIRQLPNGDKVKLVVIAPFIMPKERQQLLQLGFDEHIAMPVSERSLYSTLQRILTDEITNIVWKHLGIPPKRVAENHPKQAISKVIRNS